MPHVLYLSGKSHLLLIEEEVAYTTQLVWTKWKSAISSLQETKS
jgi:hypothetical protein